MAQKRTRSFHRRHQRSYPLPTFGARYSELNKVLMRREIQHAVRGGDLTTVGYGLYVPGAVSARDQHVGTLQALCRDTPHLVSHRTAGILWGLLDDALAPPFHLTSPPEGARIKRPSLVIAHRAQVLDLDRNETNQMTLTSPARTWVDIAVSAPLTQALILADRCRRGGRPELGEAAEPLSHRQDLADALVRRGRTPGLATARRALELSRDRVDSPMESLLRFYMHEAGLPEPEVNAWLCDEHGNRIVQPDLSIRRYQLAIQYEGWEFHSDPPQMLKDVRRQEDTEALGWLEVRITKDHMRDGGAGAIAKIIQALRT